MPEVGQPGVEHHKERLAVGLEGLYRADPDIRAKVLPFLDLNNPQHVGFDKDGKKIVGIPFKCPLLKAAAVCDAVRNERWMGKGSLMEVYMLRKVWSRVPNAQRLTESVNGEVALSRQAFNVPVKLAEYVPLAPRRLF